MLRRVQSPAGKDTLDIPAHLETLAIFKTLHEDPSSCFSIIPNDVIELITKILKHEILIHQAYKRIRISINLFENLSGLGLPDSDDGIGLTMAKKIKHTSELANYWSITTQFITCDWLRANGFVKPPQFSCGCDVMLVPIDISVRADKFKIDNAIAICEDIYRNRIFSDRSHIPLVYVMINSHPQRQSLFHAKDSFDELKTGLLSKACTRVIDLTQYESKSKIFEALVKALHRMILEPCVFQQCYPQEPHDLQSVSPAIQPPYLEPQSTGCIIQ